MSMIDCVVDRLNENFRAIARANGVAHHPGPIEWFMSVPRGGVERIFNVTLTEEDADSEIAWLVGEIRRKAAPDAILLTPRSSPANLEAVLSSKGFALLPEIHWAHAMALDLSGFSTGEPAAALPKIVEVRDAGLFSKWITFVNATLFGTELMRKDDFVNMLDLPRVTFYLGLADGLTLFATMCVHDSVSAGFELTATAKEHRSEGVLRRYMGSILRDLQGRGIGTAAVFPHPNDYAEYEDMGFKTHFRIKVYEFRRER